MQMKTERFEMRLDHETLEQVDNWRSGQFGLPSRSEAVRRLVNAGLTASGKDKVRFTAGEKLILMMLRDLYKHHDTTGEIDHEFVFVAMKGGHYWGLGSKYPGLFHDHTDSPQVVTEVIEILDMWTLIESGYEKLSPKDKRWVDKESEQDSKDTVFRGFDGNNESEHYAIAVFLIDELERFVNFRNRIPNSHVPSIDLYRRMLSTFKPMRANLMGRELSAMEIIELLKRKNSY